VKKGQYVSGSVYISTVQVSVVQVKPLAVFSVTSIVY
jgi:hypothetical protein